MWEYLGNRPVWFSPSRWHKQELQRLRHLAAIAARERCLFLCIRFVFYMFEFLAIQQNTCFKQQNTNTNTLTSRTTHGVNGFGEACELRSCSIYKSASRKWDWRTRSEWMWLSIELPSCKEKSPQLTLDTYYEYTICFMCTKCGRQCTTPFAFPSNVGRSSSHRTLAIRLTCRRRVHCTICSEKAATDVCKNALCPIRWIFFGAMHLKNNVCTYWQRVSFCGGCGSWPLWKT